ncbi:hypothetical protein [Nonomuraea antimicrobica]|uniref:hypothetical protein n=1 Tax=Nonomuraea antimicrobica TaxID=561173 RepID=UPI003CD0AF9E
MWDVTRPGRPSVSSVLYGHGTYVDSVAFSGDGRLLAIGGGADHPARLWGVDPVLANRAVCRQGVPGPHGRAVGELLLPEGDVAGILVMARAWDERRALRRPPALHLRFCGPQGSFKVSVGPR